MKLQRLLDILLWLLLIVAIAATMTGWAAVMTGCTPLAVSPTQATGNAIARADVRVERIETEAADVGGSSGKVIRTEATAARADLSDATKANDEISVLVGKYRDSVTKLETELTAERRHWLGYRLRTIGAWGIGITVGVVLVLKIIGNITTTGFWGLLTDAIWHLSNGFLTLLDRGIVGLGSLIKRAFIKK